MLCFHIVTCVWLLHIWKNMSTCMIVMVSCHLIKNINTCILACSKVLCMMQGNMSHVDIIFLPVDIIYLVWWGQKFAFADIRCFFLIHGEPADDRGSILGRHRTGSDTPWYALLLFYFHQKKILSLIRNCESSSSPR